MANRFEKGNYMKRDGVSVYVEPVQERGRKCSLLRARDIGAAPAPEPVPITSIVANNVQLLRYLRYYGPD